MTTFAIAGLQLELSRGDNINEISRQIGLTMARFPWVKMIVLGELAAFGSNVAAAQTLPGPAEMHFCGLAAKHDVWIVAGSLYEVHEDRVYNTTPVINPEGQVITRHRKLFPFLPYEKGISAGHQHTVFDVPHIGRFGVSICYDMWFPETTRAMISLGAEVILHPTLTNTIDRNLELAIARASAGTNQCYFIDVNSTGHMAYGASIVVGPEGDVIHQAGRGPEIIPVHVDLARVRRTRELGLLGLGQPLKSFRDSTLHYPQYDSNQPSPALHSLGPLL